MHANIPRQPETYDETKVHAKLNFAAAESQPRVSETTPPVITDTIREFAKSLGDSAIVRVPVIADDFGLYGWCSDGVREKIKHDGGSIVFGWTIWEWPKVLLTAEFHAVWQSPSGKLLDITPKPQHETSILFVPDYERPQDFDFDKRPLNRRRSLAPQNNPAEAVARMTPAQRSFERQRATKAGMSLSDWMAAKPAYRLPALVDELIETCNRRDQLVDSIPGHGLVNAPPELTQVVTRCVQLMRTIKAAGL
jgi:hypothetical protein